MVYLIAIEPCTSELKKGSNSRTPIGERRGSLSDMATTRPSDLPIYGNGVFFAIIGNDAPEVGTVRER
jgi:hypothetical protein